MFLVWWYKSKPVFWLPKGWFPSILVWILSFPSAPLGMCYPFLLRPSPWNCGRARGSGRGWSSLYIETLDGIELYWWIGSISPFFWSTACQYAFATIKDILLQLIPVPSPSKPPLACNSQEADVAAPTSMPVPAQGQAQSKPQATIEMDKLD